jgi:alkylation response protein AidB-like acyl-CoA dehydrogenase
MDFALAAEQEDFVAAVRAFTNDAIRPHVQRWDSEHELPMEAVKQMGDFGLFGLPFPEEYGGSGADFLTLCLAIEEIARVDSSLAITLEAAVGLGSMPIYRFGTEPQRQRWLPSLLSGDALAGFGLTEPGGGSDAAATKTTARLEEGQWAVNGSKSFITNSGTPITVAVTITAVTGRDGNDKEISALVIPTDATGFEVGPSLRKMGWWHSDTHELSFDEVRVPEDALLGERGSGFRNFLEILDDGRIALASLAVGLAQGCLDESLAYARNRTAFGRPIGSFQVLQFKIADMAMKIDLARHAYYRAAWLKQNGRPYKRQAAIAKLYASETAVEAARDAVQIHGGYGYIEETPVCRHYRDAKILEIGEGTSEIMRMLIARDLGLPQN